MRVDVNDVAGNIRAALPAVVGIVRGRPPGGLHADGGAGAEAPKV